MSILRLYRPEVLFGKSIRGDQIGDISLEDQLILIPKLPGRELTYDHIGNCEQDYEFNYLGRISNG